MEIKEIKELITKGESETLEFKKTTGQRTDAAKSICAMLNKNGGYLLFGISDDGCIVGQQVTAKTMADIHHEIRCIDPSVTLNVENIPISEHKSVIVVHAFADDAPYTYDGKPYLREGPSTRIMPRILYDSMAIEKVHPVKRWENQEAYNYTMDDLDASEIVRTVEEGIRRDRLEEPGTRDLEKMLMGLGLVSDKGTLYNAAVVLFSKREKLLPHYIQCSLKVARFRGIDKTEFIDNKQIQGNAFEIFKRAQMFLQEHLPIAGKIVSGQYERIDEPLIQR